MATKPSKSLDFPSYLTFLFSGPMSLWWVLITGAVSLIAWVVTPADVIMVSKIMLLALIIVVSLVLFVGISVTFKGWQLYREAGNPTVIEIPESEGERIFLLKGLRPITTGEVLEVYRRRDATESSIGLIEVIHEQEDGEVQAIPLWIKPVHLGDIQNGAVSPSSLIVHRNVSKRTLVQWIDDQANRSVRELLKRGIE
jgi:hypothetical protein